MKLAVGAALALGLALAPSAFAQEDPITIDETRPGDVPEADPIDVPDADSIDEPGGVPEADPVDEPIDVPEDDVGSFGEGEPSQGGPLEPDPAAPPPGTEPIDDPTPETAPYDPEPVEIEPADDTDEEEEASTPYLTPTRVTRDDGLGFSVTAGGGIFGYTDEDTRDATSEIGGNYTARLAIGTRRPVGFEIGYVGSAQNVEALGLDEDAVLLSNGVEGVVRLNMGSAGVQPYLIGGAAWRRYDITNADFNTSSIRDSDDVIEFPVGGGLAFRWQGLVLDARAAYRIATDDDLLRTDDEGPRLDAWDVTLKAGLEF